MCALVTRGRRAADKGHYRLVAEDFSTGLPNCFVLWVPDNRFLLGAEDAWLLDAFQERLWIAVELMIDGLERQRLERSRPLRINQTW